MKSVKISLGEIKELIDQGYGRNKRSVKYDEKKQNLLHIKLGCTSKAIVDLFKVRKDIAAYYREKQAEFKDEVSGLASKIVITEEDIKLDKKEPKAPKEPKPAKEKPKRGPVKTKTEPIEPENIEEEEEELEITGEEDDDDDLDFGNYDFD